MKFAAIFSVIFGLYIVNVSCVKITKISVPSTYVIDYNYCRPLILDCDYEFRMSDIGFVLKWYHNSHLIYQWIPPRKPYIFSKLKYHINMSFISNSENTKYKYRGIQLRPHHNLTGDWMCSVQTYKTHDRQIKRMQVIVPEKSFELYHHDLTFLMVESQIFIVICTVKHIYPEPELNILINNNYSVISEVKSECDENGFYNKSIMAQIDKHFVPSPSTINCILEINGTDYIKKKRFIYYDYRYDKNHPDMRNPYSSRYLSNGWLSIPNRQFLWLTSFFIAFSSSFY